MYAAGYGRRAEAGDRRISSAAGIVGAVGSAVGNAVVVTWLL